MIETMVHPAALRYDQRGLVAVVAQEESSGAVLMVAYADRAAVEATLATGEAHFWSRSRQRLWRKGETSGNVLRVVAMRSDCDGDTLLLSVRAAGPACHRGTRTCFEADPGLPASVDRPSRNSVGQKSVGVASADCAHLELGWLADVIAARRGADPDSSYTARLLSEGVERIGRKIGEEAMETVIAAMAGRPGELANEAADLLYHLLVLLEASGVKPAAVAEVLAARHRQHREGRQGS